MGSEEAINAPRVQTSTENKPTDWGSVAVKIALIGTVAGLFIPLVDVWVGGQKKEYDQNLKQQAESNVVTPLLEEMRDIKADLRDVKTDVRYLKREFREFRASIKDEKSKELYK